jgi:hypothetical protein
MQESQLHIYQEQENYHGAAGTQQVLPALPKAPAAQGNQVEWESGENEPGPHQGE